MASKKKYLFLLPEQVIFKISLLKLPTKKNDELFFLKISIQKIRKWKTEFG